MVAFHRNLSMGGARDILSVAFLPRGLLISTLLCRPSHTLLDLFPPRSFHHLPSSETLSKLLFQSRDPALSSKKTALSRISLRPSSPELIRDLQAPTFSSSFVSLRFCFLGSSVPLVVQPASCASPSLASNHSVVSIWKSGYP